MPGVASASSSRCVRVVAVVGERPGDAGDDARAALDQAAHELREGLLADQARSAPRRTPCVAFLSASGSAAKIGSIAPGPDVLQPRNRLLPGRTGRIGRRPDLGDEPVGAQVREKAHSAFLLEAASCTYPPSLPPRGSAHTRRGSFRCRRRCRSRAREAGKRAASGRLRLCHSRQQAPGDGTASARPAH